jgi:hypothetical protein
MVNSFINQLLEYSWLGDLFAKGILNIHELTLLEQTCFLLPRLWDVRVQGWGLDPDTRKVSWSPTSRFLGILVFSIGPTTPYSHSDITANSATLAQQRSFSGDVKLVCECVITAPDRAVELPTAYGFSLFRVGLNYSTDARSTMQVFQHSDS